MKQLLILSGKGGTGKTTVAGAFITLSRVRACADCDVDAPNLHLLLRQESPPQKTDYFGLPKAHIDETLCTRCGQCHARCRFDAIQKNRGAYTVDPFACEGCGVCQMVCPAKAVTLVPAAAGERMLYRSEQGVFSTARLKMGSGTSGKLVTEVKKQLREAAEGAEWAIIDGSPGIGCPVIASMSGASLVLIVAEPSLSGISDMQRILKTAQIFGTPAAVCVNKWDTSPENTIKIITFCKADHIPFTGRIPFDREAVKAVNSGRTIAELPCPAGQAAAKVYANTMKLLFPQREGAPHDH